MKSFRNTLLILAVFLFSGLQMLDAQTARVQIIHNSADLKAKNVEVKLNGETLIEKFAFRTATEFIDVPADVNLDLEIIAKTDDNVVMASWKQQVMFNDGEKYMVVASGLLVDIGYSPFMPFNIYATGQARETGTDPNNTDVIVFHGSTDAPTVDVYETGVGAGEIIDDLMWGEFAGYLSLPTEDYVLQIRDESGSDVVAAYSAPLKTLQLEGQALAVIASGFLNPANNRNGEAFGLYVALPSGGDLIALPSEQIDESESTARVQIIHNSADLKAKNVEVKVNGETLIEKFAFRTATPFIDVPADVNLDLEIVAMTDDNEIMATWKQQVMFKSSEKYIVVASGLLADIGYNPFMPFNIYATGQAREVGTDANNTDVIVFHGSTDAPTVDVYETGVGAGKIIDNLMWGEFAGYLSLPTEDYVLQIRDESGSDVVAAYSAPLKTLQLEGQALAVIASGFLNPANNRNGEAFGLYVALPSGGGLIELPSEQIDRSVAPARVQIIHNSADLKAKNVEVKVNGETLIEKFAFRTATEFIDVPADVNLDLEIIAKTDDNVVMASWKQQVMFESGEKYIVVASGLLVDIGYNPFMPFNIYATGQARETGTDPSNTDVIVFHGSTDAPTVDVYETGVGAGMIIDNLMYGEFAGYLSLPTEDYVLQIRDESGTDVVAEYTAPLKSLQLEGQALAVIASGFLNPANNRNGEAFGLYVALPSGGDLIDLPATRSINNRDMARVQVIHNSADAAAEVVDVWLNDILLLDNFTFRNASPFVDAPAGEEFTIAIQGPNSTSPENPIWSMNYTLADGETYILVADGIVSETGYEPSQAFDIAVYPMGREVASMMDMTDVLVHHGSTDAPTVDVYEIGVGAGEIVNDLMYFDFAGYLELGTLDYVLEVRDESGMNKVAAYQAPLATLGLDGAAITVVASGFLNPANNSNGPAFGLWVALASGGALVELPMYEPMARVQVIHNSADAAAQTVDVWLDNTLLLDNFMFRYASPFVDAPAGEEFTISIQGPNSTSPENPIWSMNYTLEDGETYILVADGIVSASGYEPSQAFDIAVYPMGREMASMMDMTDVLVHHGSTDAPTVDVYEIGVGAGEIVNNLMYFDFAGYLELGTLDYVLEVRDESGMNKVAAYQAPLATLGLDGAAITVVASGFLNPANNSNGPAFGLWVALASGGALVELPMYEPMARVQVIHNSADAAAEVVDVWLNDILLLDNFTFRNASPFVDAPAGEEFTIAIQGPDSSSPENPIWSMNYTLADGETYILVADGIVSASGYEPSQAFDIAVYPMGREMASMMDMTDVLVHHGSTDAPTVDVYEIGVGAGEIVNDLMYFDFAGYLELGTLDYVLEIRDESGMNKVAAYQAPLESLGLGGAAITVVASGFLNPANNSNGPAFGLWVALASGGALVELPMYEPMARVQVIHNSADAAAEVVDVWLNDILLLDNFTFRNASPFVDAPAGEEFTIAIQGPDSSSPENPIWSKNYTLADGETYILVADGIVSASGYEPSQAFDIAVYPMGREMASMMDMTDVLVHHGSTDAPTVDVYEIGVGAGEIVNDLMYFDFAGYLELGTLDYVLEVRDESGMNKVAAYQAPLATLGLDGAAITVVASGFLNPANNSNGPAFGLWVALASGGALVELPMYEPMARVQVIHNSADAAAQTVDVWLDNTLLLDNFMFRYASPFVDAPAGTEFTIAIQGPNSTSPENPIWSMNYTLEDGETYILVADGIVSATGYDPVKPFDIYVYPMGREMASMAENTDVLVFHGSTDAPTVDIFETGVGAGQIVDDLMYGEFDGYLELPTADYGLQIRDETGENVVATFGAPLQSLGLGGQAISVIASGFLNPDNNSGGPGFGLYAAIATGGELVQLTNTSSIDDVIELATISTYPNPASDILNVRFSVKESNDNISVDLFNLLGSKVKSDQFGLVSNENIQHQMNISDMPEGLYIMTINAGESTVSRKVQIVR